MKSLSSFYSGTDPNATDPNQDRQKRTLTASDMFARSGLANSLLLSSQECSVVSLINAVMQQSISAKQIKRRRNLCMGSAQ